MEPVLLEKEAPVAWITLNRPEQRNALSLELMASMLDRLDELAEDPAVRVIIVRGTGPAFSSGHDLKEMAGGGGDLHRYRGIFAACNRLMLRLHRLPQPVIAQVHGVATAAGCQLVAACDLAVAEEGARFAVPGVKIGLFCTTPMVPLVRVIGRRRALEMLLTGRFISAQEAERYGLVNRVVPADQLAGQTLALAREIAAFSRFTVGFGKKAFYEQVDLDESAAYGYAMEAASMNCLAEDAQEGIAAFLQKRPPRWRDR